MPRKPKLTKKDQYVLILGVLLAFLIQIGYDLIHQIVFYEANHYWLATQSVLMILIGIFTYYIMGRIEGEPL
ncbi:MAG: hypothetical protein FK732_09760 [Asgard group archaeon]|nr:hypothetical protein [Asgard group archaeon]